MIEKEGVIERRRGEGGGKKKVVGQKKQGARNVVSETKVNKRT